MTTALEYRLRAKQFQELAKDSQDAYAKEALVELANEFNKAAESLEHAPAPARRH